MEKTNEYIGVNGVFVELYRGTPRRIEPTEGTTDHWLEEREGKMRSFRVSGKVEIIPHLVFHDGKMKHNGFLFRLCDESVLNESN